MRQLRLRSAIYATLFMAVAAVEAAAQAPAIVDPRVTPAAANQKTSATRPATQSVRFSRRPAQVGDQIDQTITREMRLTTTQKQGDKVVESSTRTLRGRQERRIITARVQDGRSQAVVVRYGEVTKQIEIGESPVNAKTVDQNPPAEVAAEPIAGKTYRCWREAEKLIVTDEKGDAPSPAEIEIVAADMDPVGKPNPFAEFLDGCTVTIGQNIALIPELAHRMLTIDDRLGKVSKFQLTLREIREEAGVKCAVFSADIEAVSSSGKQMRLVVDGPLIVEVDTCRAVLSNFTGPLVMSETRGSYSAQYLLISTGKLSTTITSTYRDATR